MFPYEKANGTINKMPAQKLKNYGMKNFESHITQYVLLLNYFGGYCESCWGFFKKKTEDIRKTNRILKYSVNKW